MTLPDWVIWAGFALAALYALGLIVLAAVVYVEARRPDTPGEAAQREHAQRAYSAQARAEGARWV